MKYKFTRVADFPDHVKECCYAIKDNGHTMFPEDVVRRLNDLEKALSKKPQKTAHNSDYVATLRIINEFKNVCNGLTLSKYCQERINYGKPNSNYRRNKIERASI